MRRNLWKTSIGKIVLAAVVAMIGLAGATAIAARHLGGHGPEFMKKHVAAFIDGALDAAKATPEQRTKIDAARDQAFVTVEESHRGRQLDIDEALALFTADRLDAAKVQAFRGKHEAQAQKTGDAIERALLSAHDTLDAGQRKAVAAYVRENHPGHRGKWGPAIMKKMASHKLDDALDAVSATAAQKVAIEAARDHVFAAFEEARGGDPAEHMEKALALFEADRVDPAAVQALRAEHLAKMRKAGDAVVQGIYDLHDALTPEQRRAMVDYVRAQQAKWQGHGGGSCDHEGDKG